jgi:CRP-like cAMP-binding protein
MMFDSFVTYINSYTTTPLTDSETDLIRSFFTPKKFRKRQYFLQEGEVCKYTAFITRGAMRQYRVDAAWEDTDVLLITKTDLGDLVDRIHTLSEWLRKLDTNFAIASQKRISAAISLTAEERYHDLENTNPAFLQRFPQHIIASYLGINRETLSRIRSRSFKK